jgi:insulysin
VALEQIEELRKLTLQELIDFDEYVKVGAPRKRTLSIRVHGNLHSSEYKSEASESHSARIDNIFSFRKSQSLYGSFKGLTGQVKL